MLRIVMLLLLLVQVAIFPSCVSVYSIPTAVTCAYRDLKPLERKWAARGFRISSYMPVADLEAPANWIDGRLEVSLCLTEPAEVSLEEARRLVQELYRDYYALVSPQFIKKGISDPRMRIEVRLAFVGSLDASTVGTAIESIWMDGRERTFSGMLNGKKIRMGMIREDVREELADLVDEYNFNGSKIRDRCS